MYQSPANTSTAAAAVHRARSLVNRMLVTTYRASTIAAARNTVPHRAIWLPTRSRRSFSPARQRSRCWAEGAISSAVARVAQTIEAKKALRRLPGRSAKRCWKGAVSRKASSTWTPGSITRSSWSSSISSRSRRSPLPSPSAMRRPPPVQLGSSVNGRRYHPAMELLERQAFLESLEGFLASARGGRGCLVLVGGEAGIGKTSLVRAFCDRHGGDTRALWGACDALRTPRPLGPLLDIAREAGGELAAVVAAEPTRHRLFSAFLDLLDSAGPPVVAVVEDAHWADEATLDLLVFAGRRVAGTPAMVVVTYRDDEAGPGHPLRTAVGDLATAGWVHRLELPALTREAVATLAGPEGIDPDRLHQATGGNPFFVTEVLGAASGEVPPTVRDAVLARAARLSPEARGALDASAVVPDRVELELLEAAAGAGPAAVDECVAAGMLRDDGRGRAGARHGGRGAGGGARGPPGGGRPLRHGPAVRRRAGLPAPGRAAGGVRGRVRVHRPRGRGARRLGAGPRPLAPRGRPRAGGRPAGPPLLVPLGRRPQRRGAPGGA